MTSNGGSEMTSVLWLFVVAFTLLHPSHTISLPSALQSSWCVDNGCAEQFEGLGGCVNLAAPLQIGTLSKRFDLGATSLKGLCGTFGCCHCMKLLPNSTEEAATAASKPSAKNPGKKKPKPKKPKKPKQPKKPQRPKKPKRPKKPQRPKKPKRPKQPKRKKPKPKKPNAKKPKTKNPKTKKPKSKTPKPKIQNKKSQF